TRHGLAHRGGGARHGVRAEIDEPHGGEHTGFGSAMLAPMRDRKKRSRRRPGPKERERALRVLEALDRAMPDARIELDYTNDLELLVAVMLSAQCTDAMVNRCTPSLFSAYRTAADYARAE